MAGIDFQNMDALRSSYLGANPFPHIVMDDFLDSELVLAAANSYLPYEEAQSLGKSFSKVNESKKVQIVDPSKFPKPVTDVVALLSSPSFIKNLSYVSGIDNLVWDPTFSGGGMHQTGSSGWLDVHVDFNFNEPLQLHRRLNLLLYLNPVWDGTWGGSLELWDQDVETLHHSIAPKLNRCAIFTTSQISQHGVSAVSCPVGVQRKSIALYYYTKEAPAGWDGKKHSTIFTARPEEFMKRHVLMKGESAIASGKNAWRNVKSGVKNILGL